MGIGATGGAICGGNGAFGGGGADDLPSPHVPISILCFPGTIGGGGIPAFFFIATLTGTGGTGLAG